MRRHPALWLWLWLTACADQHEGAPGAGEATHPPSGGGASTDASSSTEGGANASDLAEGGVTVFDAAPATEPCLVSETSCDVARVDVRGTSPRGALQLTEVGVSYWGGFTEGTDLFADGSWGGQPVTLSAQIYTTLLLDVQMSAAPPGTYRVGQPSPGTLQVMLRTCDGPVQIESATLRIDRHDGPAPMLSSEVPGTPVRFEGELTITEPGWSLTLPFSVRSACYFGIDV